MMTSQNNNTRLIEKYLSGLLSPIDRFLFESKLIVNLDLKKEFNLQKKIYSLVKMYHRQKLKEKMELVHRKLFNDPDKISFQQNIHQLFK